MRHKIKNMCKLDNYMFLCENGNDSKKRLFKWFKSYL